MVTGPHTVGHAEVIRVLLADEAPIRRAGLSHWLSCQRGVTVVAETDTAAGLIQKAAELRPDVVVMGMCLPDKSGGAMCQELIAWNPELAVLLVSETDWDIHLAQAWMVGAAGLLGKKASPEELVTVLRQVARGYRVFTPEQQRRIRVWYDEVGKVLQTLTLREWAILQLVTSGKGNREIADTFGVSVKAIEKYVSALFMKFRLTSRTELAAFVWQHHLEGRVFPTMLGGQSRLK